VAIVWPCPLAVDAYAAAGRKTEFPRLDCSSCLVPMTFWSGYLRHVREAGRCQKIFIPRLRCRSCRVTHALLPAFVLAWRLDVAEAVGSVTAAARSGPRSRRLPSSWAASRSARPPTLGGGR
jgi:hypothetical protein